AARRKTGSARDAHGLLGLVEDGGGCLAGALPPDVKQAREFWTIGDQFVVTFLKGSELSDDGVRHGVFELSVAGNRRGQRDGALASQGGEDVKEVGHAGLGMGVVADFA